MGSEMGGSEVEADGGGAGCGTEVGDDRGVIIPFSRRTSACFFPMLDVATLALSSFYDGKLDTKVCPHKGKEKGKEKENLK